MLREGGRGLRKALPVGRIQGSYRTHSNAWCRLMDSQGDLVQIEPEDWQCKLAAEGEKAMIEGAANGQCTTDDSGLGHCYKCWCQPRTLCRLIKVA